MGHAKSTVILTTNYILLTCIKDYLYKWVSHLSLGKTMIFKSCLNMSSNIMIIQGWGRL